MEFPQGPFQNSVVKLARPGLRSALRSSLQQARQTLRKDVRDDLTVKSGEQTQRVRLVVQPMPEMGDGGPLFMIVFQELGNATAPTSAGQFSADSEAVIQQLQQQLERIRFDLEHTVQELERSNEGLKYSNEELRSINAELQSANEELQTSKEEIQAGMEALSRAQSDLQNLLDGTQIATIFLDNAGNINSFTPSVTDIYNLKEPDLGRSLSDITHNAVAMPAMPTLQRLDDFDAPSEDDLTLLDGRVFLRRVLPYRHEDRVDGVILTFVDITEIRIAERWRDTERVIAKLLTDASSLPEVQDQILETLRGNLGADVALLWLPDEPRTQLACVAVASDAASGKLAQFIQQSESIQLARGQGLPGRVWETREPVDLQDVSECEWYVRRDAAAAGNLRYGVCVPIVSGNRFRGAIEIFADRELPQCQALVETLHSIGLEIGLFIRRGQADERRRDEEARKTAILEAAFDCIVTMDVEGKIVDFNATSERTFGYSAKDVRGRPLADVLLDDQSRQLYESEFNRFLDIGESNIVGSRIEATAKRADGTPFPIELAVAVTHQRSGEPFFTGFLRDISKRRLREQAAQDRERRYAMALKSGRMAAWEWKQGESIWTNELYELLGLSPDVEASPETLFKQVHAEDLAGLRQAWERATHGIATYDHEFRIIRPGGDVRWLKGVGEWIRNSSGEVVSIFGLNWDVTEQRESAAKLARQAQVDRFLADSGASLSSTLDYEQTLHELTVMCVPELADWAFVDLIDEEGVSRRVAVAPCRIPHTENWPSMSPGSPSVVSA